MTKGLARSISRGANFAQITKQTIAVRGLSISVTDPGAAVGFGTVVAGGLPEGNILFLGAVGYLQFTTDSADVIAAFNGDYSVGTTATADATITGTDADLLPSTALGAATAKVSPYVRAASTDALGGGIFDNTAGSLAVNINLVIDDASISATSAFTAEGVIYLSYVVLGDD